MPKPRFLLLLAGLMLLQRLPAQTPSPMVPAAPILDAYIRIGLDSNLALHQRNFDLQKAQLDLRRARTLFFPQATFSSAYTLADGGRTESVPIGNLLNNVYSTLNQLTGSTKFPQVANQSIQFLPNNFQDTKMEISLPILNTDLQHNKQVSSEKIDVSMADRDIYSRDLIRSVRQAYYQYLQTEKASQIYGVALQLAKENRRVCEKFVENHMATREIVLRAQTQVSQVESSLVEARNNVRNAAAWFNFLLNRSLASPILTASSLMAYLPADSSSVSITPAAPFNQASANPAPTNPALAAMPPLSPGREEFSRLNSWTRILESDLKWDRSYIVPKLNAFYDVGFQGFGIHFNSSQFYQLAGVQLIWPLFKANDNKYKIRQAIIDIRFVHEQYSQLTAQLNLEQETASNNYSSALEALRALADEVSSSRETYRLAEKRFDEGQALQIELIDSRNQMTDAEIRYSLGRLTLLNRAADLERVTAAYPINK